MVDPFPVVTLLISDVNFPKETWHNGACFPHINSTSFFEISQVIILIIPNWYCFIPLHYKTHIWTKGNVVLIFYVIKQIDCIIVRTFVWYACGLWYIPYFWTRCIIPCLQLVIQCNHKTIPTTGSYLGYILAMIFTFQTIPQILCFFLYYVAQHTRDIFWQAKL